MLARNEELLGGVQEEPQSEFRDVLISVCKKDAIAVMEVLGEITEIEPGQEEVRKIKDWPESVTLIYREVVSSMTQGINFGTKALNAGANGFSQEKSEIKKC